jgi:twitching motility protein PilT
MRTLDRYLLLVKERKASDLHISAALPAKLRIDGDLQNIEQKPVPAATAEEWLREILTDEQKGLFDSTGDLDFVYDIPNAARFRVNYFQCQRGMGGAFRIIPENVSSFETLCLPPILKKFAEYKSGLILITGPTGSGKSTTLAAIIDFINTNFRKHIVTLEDPIEYVHANKKSIINQRQVGSETESFVNGLQAAIHQDPEVLVVGEMRDYETIRLVVGAAETGILVFATLHTNSAEKTLDRIIDVFPAGQQQQIRAMLAESLKGVMSQLLFRRIDQPGRVPSCEVLIGTPAVSHLIREGKIAEIVSIIQSSKSIGMQTMDDALYELLARGWISAEDAFITASNKKRFEPFIARDRQKRLESRASGIKKTGTEPEKE